MDATFYTVTDARFFPGTVALMNSLRLTGNRGELVVLDLGLTSPQRTLLGRHATLVEPREGIHQHPMLYKCFPYLLDPRGVIVMIDSDMIVTRKLDYEVRLAEEGKICLFADEDRARARWFAEWETLLGLGAPARRQAYRNAGFVAFSVEHWPWLLSRWWNANQCIPGDVVFTPGGAGHPLWAGDQDALNAILMSEVPKEAVPELDTIGLLPGELAQGRIVSERTLECSFRGRPVSLLHYTGSPKPWEARAWTRVRADAFVRLLARVLYADDVPLRLQPDTGPWWLRQTLRGRTALGLLSVVNRVVRGVAGALPQAAEDRLRSWRDARHQQAKRPHEAV